MAREDLIEVFGSKPRIRVCGIIQNNKGEYLLLKHEGLGAGGYIWAPPGGGLEYAETAHDCLKREIMEETHLEAIVGKLQFVNEFIGSSLHAIELFFKITSYSGEAILGVDPEMEGKAPVLSKLKFFSLEEIKDCDPVLFHNFFRHLEIGQSIDSLPSYLTFTS